MRVARPLLWAAVLSFAAFARATESVSATAALEELLRQGRVVSPARAVACAPWEEVRGVVDAPSEAERLLETVIDGRGAVVAVGHDDGPSWLTLPTSLGAAEALLALGGRDPLESDDGLVLLLGPKQWSVYQDSGMVLVAREGPDTSGPVQAAADLVAGLPLGPGCASYERSQAGAVATFLRADRSELWKRWRPTHAEPGFRAPSSAVVQVRTVARPEQVVVVRAWPGPLLDLVPGSDQEREVVRVLVTELPLAGGVTAARTKDGEVLVAAVRQGGRHLEKALSKVARRQGWTFEATDGGGFVLTTPAGGLQGIAASDRLVLGTDGAAVGQAAGGEGSPWIDPELEALSDAWPLVWTAEHGTWATRVEGDAWTALYRPDSDEVLLRQQEELGSWIVDTTQAVFGSLSDGQ